MNRDVFGKYIHERTGSHYLELKPDGNYFLFQGSAGVTGTYEVNGAEITIFGAESASQGKIQDGVIIDSEGDKWVRAKTGSEINDDPLASMSWLPAVMRRDDFPWELIDVAGLLLMIFLAVFLARL